MPGSDRDKAVKIYDTREPGKGEGTDTMGLYGNLLDQVGVCIGHPVVSEVKGPPDRAIWYTYDPADWRDRKVNVDTVLQNLTEQTGLTCKREKRRLKMLLVERAK